jgi:hypothetical protein
MRARRGGSAQRGRRAAEGESGACVQKGGARLASCLAIFACLSEVLQSAAVHDWRCVTEAMPNRLLRPLLIPLPPPTTSARPLSVPPEGDGWTRCETEVDRLTRCKPSVVWPLGGVGGSTRCGSGASGTVSEEQEEESRPADQPFIEPHERE